ncbi:unnamed protein product [Phytomonas sp. Hart1]|nr:unnamed protein product [Phytomonas sp. Hart1]|eukprot:CCW66110.1 unnamed protein product [Phytomonas sp. isolate Hart1]
MLQRNRLARYYWSRYRFPTQMPKFDGPPPKDAPQNMNNTKTNEYIDPVDDKFPVSIRGNLCRPDVPEDQYVDSWYLCTSMTHHMGDFRPWSASAPANAYRFRPFNEFDSKGREYIKHLREFSRYDPKKSRGKGQKCFPFRDAYLTMMASGSNPTSPPSLETIMDRAIIEKNQHGKVLTPLMRQWDVGRLEKPPSCAGRIAVDNLVFPFNWNTEDWYEYEVSKVRNRRFTFENNDSSGIEGSEVTYRIVLEGFWDHHVGKLSEDVCAFLRDVGRQIVEEKLKVVRNMLESVESGGIDPDIIESFNLSLKGPFGGKDYYDKEEVANFVRADLQRLEEQCVGVINRCNVPIPGFSNLYDPQVSWPYVEHLEPWVRMAEFWTSSSDTSFTEVEMSTTHYEFRKYFRVVVVKLPFQSTEFEQRIYGIRHWLHRQTSCEFHTTYRRNIVHDASVFPTEHDPSVPTSHEHHRLFSFALDWQSAPVGFLSVEAVQKGDTWESVAERIGCSAEELREANDGLEDLVEGLSLTIPSNARRRLPSFGALPQVLPLARSDGHARIQTWEEAAALLNCCVEDLQQANGYAALTYRVEGNRPGFDESIQELNVPHTSWVSSREQEFSTSEKLFQNDTWESVAQRLQCTLADLQAANPNVQDLSTVGTVAIPPTARAPRRMVNPQLRIQAATDALLAKVIGEQGKYNLETLPHLPENASKFPHEYHTTTSRFPATPRESACIDDWLAYTAKYLDKDLTVRQEPTPLYNVNKLWPMQQVPGKVDQTPFEEDQTWFMHPIPVQQMEQHHPEKDLQDLPFVNHEQFPRSIEWTAP